MLHPEEQPRAFRLPVKRLVIGAVVCALCLAAACTQAMTFPKRWGATWSWMAESSRMENKEAAAIISRLNPVMVQ